MSTTRKQKFVSAGAALLLLSGVGLVIANAASRNYVDKPHNTVSQSATGSNGNNQTTAGVYLLNAEAAISQADKLCSARWMTDGAKILPSSKTFFLRKTATGEVQGAFACGPVKAFGSAIPTGYFDTGEWVVTQTPAGVTFAAKEISQIGVAIPAGMETFRPDGEKVSNPDLLNNG